MSSLAKDGLRKSDMIFCILFPEVLGRNKTACKIINGKGGGVRAGVMVRVGGISGEVG